MMTTTMTMPEAADYLTVALRPDAPLAAPRPSAEACELVAFWTAAGHEGWFAQKPAFDALFRDRFLALHVRAARGELDHWTGSTVGALALVVLLDQFPRHAFRGTPRMYATDAMARAVASRAIAKGHDRLVDDELRKFFYLPFAHSEDLADQERAVALCGPWGGVDLAHACRHRDIVYRFGRFPHRNPILGRPMTEVEQAYLDAGGYRG